ncbi:MAG: hypothetical protein F6K18_08610 [Okeania sp. SIO2C2]|uniref:hypothetical protein n=1 Tax=Okeania sp. SIO2C2 TaxID=2607787 RepID=UPI0013BB41C9|nr:hypothetical protein [Okeania sp. SIO2C2]NEP86889.1 hypothetical protein [Okeania sp. SIO2C2]
MTKIKTDTDLDLQESNLTPLSDRIMGSPVDVVIYCQGRQQLIWQKARENISNSIVLEE